MALSESFSITQNYFGHKDNETGSKITRRRGRAREKVREVQFENGNVKFMRRRVGSRQQLISRHSREREGVLRWRCRPRCHNNHNSQGRTRIPKTPKGIPPSFWTLVFQLIRSHVKWETLQLRTRMRKKERTTTTRPVLQKKRHHVPNKV